MENILFMDELVLSRSLVGLDIIINIHTMTVWMALNLKPQALFYFFYFCTLPLVCCALLIYLYLGMQFSPGPLLRGSGASTQFRWPPSYPVYALDLQVEMWGVKNCSPRTPVFKIPFKSGRFIPVEKVDFLALPPSSCIDAKELLDQRESYGF